MKKRNKLILMAIFWLAIVVVLYSQGMITTDINKINEIIGKNPFKMRSLFMILSTVRVLFFIPQTIFIIIGSMLFGPYVGFALSVLSLSISQSIMYAIGRYFQNQLLGEEFLEKNRVTIAILKKYGYKMVRSLVSINNFTPLFFRLAETKIPEIIKNRGMRKLKKNILKYSRNI